MLKSRQCGSVCQVSPVITLSFAGSAKICRMKNAGAGNSKKSTIVISLLQCRCTTACVTVHSTKNRKPQLHQWASQSNISTEEITMAKKNDHPFFCHKHHTRKTAWDTPEYLTDADWALAHKMVSVTNGLDYAVSIFEAFENGTARDYFNRVLGVL